MALRSLRVSIQPFASSPAQNSKYDRLDIHKYPAKMLARIVRQILEKYVEPDDLVLDEFCGSGTVMVRCKRKGIASLGFDINSLPVLISSAKVADYDFPSLEDETIALIRRIKKTRGGGRSIAFPDRDYWFSKGVQRDLSKILAEISKVSDVTSRNFFKVCFSSIIRSVSNADPHIPPPVYSKRMRSLKYRRPNAKKAFEARVWRNIRILKNIQNEVGKSVLAGAAVADARCLPLPDASVGAVITSPPYIDAQKYVRTMKLETLWLGLLSPERLDSLGKRIIGSDRVLKRELTEIDGSLADSYIRRISRCDSSGWRALIVHEFLIQMRSALREVNRVLKPGGVFALIVGDNNVAGIRVPVHRILSQFALDMDMKLIESRRDAIKYRGFMLKRHRTAGMINSECIMIFRNQDTKLASALGLSPSPLEKQSHRGSMLASEVRTSRVTISRQR